MALPLLDYSPSSQNQRVDGFEVAGDEQPRIYTTENLTSPSDMDVLILAAYRQIFNEQQMTASSRQLALESQLRSGQITAQEFIRGLATSELFRTRNYDVNNNYRFVQMCIQRLLGRDVYSDREKLAWSTVLATKGLHGFIDDLIHTEEYQTNFGSHTIPYQRRRILPQRPTGDLPFARMARYGESYRDNLPQSRKPFPGAQFMPFDWEAFVTEANWPIVTALFLSTGGLIVFLRMIAIATGGASS